MLGQVVFGLFVLLFASLSRAACQEEGMYCSIGRQTRVIQGMQVTKDCWQYKYRLNCRHTSKNDCVNISPDDCVLASERCKERAKEGDLEFCANYERDFSCKKIVKYQEEREELLKNDRAASSKEILCKGFCLDGACGGVREAADETDSDLSTASAMLNALKEIKASQDSITSQRLINLFSGMPETCKDKALEYTNCCTELGGWGELLGASCGPDAENLAKKRAEKQCVLVGKYCSSYALFRSFCWIETSTYCCYDSVLAKIINQEAKKQLALTSGSAENPECGGIALEDFKRVDLAKADFSEFYQKVVIPNIKIPNVKGDAKANAGNVARIANSAKDMPNERKGFNPSLLENGGISKCSN